MEGLLRYEMGCLNISMSKSKEDTIFMLHRNGSIFFHQGLALELCQFSCHDTEIQVLLGSFAVWVISTSMTGLWRYSNPFRFARA